MNFGNCEKIDPVQDGKGNEYYQKVHWPYPQYSPDVKIPDADGPRAVLFGQQQVCYQKATETEKERNPQAADTYAMDVVVVIIGNAEDAFDLFAVM